MSKTLIEQAMQQQVNLDLIKSWLEKNCPHINCEYGYISIHDPKVLNITCYDWSRTEILKTVADTFGTYEWMSNDNKGQIDWSREIDGVVVNIKNAKAYPEMKPRAVQPYEWPLQLNDGVSIER